MASCQISAEMGNIMEKEQFEGYKYISGGVCAAKGFTANGLNCGINPVKEKMTLEWYIVKYHVIQQQFTQEIK